MATVEVAPIVVNLNQVFGTEAIDDQVVRFTSWYSLSGAPVVLDFALFSQRTPATRANFLNYVNGGDYVDSIIHRSVPGFVIQGGGFRFGTGGLESVPTDPPVVNEFGVSNTLGTIAMAKLGGDPNSATSQWFVSLGANSDTLDPQNGGFTVFGRVTKGTFGNAQIFGDPVDFPIWDAGGALNELPLFQSFVDGIGQSWPDYSILFESVTLEPLPAGQAGESSILTYSVVSNSNSALASAVLNAGNLTVTPVSGQTGSTTITIRATDSVGNTVDDTFLVTVNASDTYSTWASRTTFSNNLSAMTQNGDGDALNNLQEYAFFGNPSTSAQPALPVNGTTGIAPGARYMTLAFPVRKFTTGLTYTVESNTGLDGSWTTVWSSTDGFSHAQVVSAVSQADRTQVTVKDVAAIGSSTRRFMRVKVVQN
ncbi:MAG: peptidylprolyl isomerase [Verrucomicrobia bacterium]|nr:peptidylprolyl isomerase [Verrucomicrobiota bacterium]